MCPAFRFVYKAKIIIGIASFAGDPQQDVHFRIGQEDDVRTRLLGMPEQIVQQPAGMTQGAEGQVSP